MRECEREALVAALQRYLDCDPARDVAGDTPAAQARAALAGAASNATATVGGHVAVVFRGIVDEKERGLIDWIGDVLPPGTKLYTRAAAPQAGSSDEHAEVLYRLARMTDFAGWVKEFRQSAAPQAGSAQFAIPEGFKVVKLEPRPDGCDKGVTSGQGVCCHRGCFADEERQRARESWKQIPGFAVLPRVSEQSQKAGPSQNALRTGIAASSPYHSGFYCSVCEGTRLLLTDVKHVWPCYQCQPSLGNRPPRADPVDTKTQPHLVGTPRLTLAEAAALWHRLQALPATNVLRGTETLLDEAFLHFHINESVHAVEAWLEAVCPTFEREKAALGEYYSGRERDIEPLIRRLSHNRWRIRVDVGDKYGEPQGSVIHAFANQAEAWEAIEAYQGISIAAPGWYKASWLGRTAPMHGWQVVFADVEEWAGLHYRKDLGSVSEAERHYWIQRYRRSLDLDGAED